MRESRLTKLRQKAFPQQILLRIQFSNKNLLADTVKIIVKSEELQENNGNGQADGNGNGRVHAKGERSEASIINIGHFVSEILRDKVYYVTDMHCHPNGPLYSEKNIRYVLCLMFSVFGDRFRNFNAREIKMMHQLVYKDSWRYVKYDRNQNGIWSLTCLHRLPNSEIDNDELIGELHFVEPTTIARDEVSREYLYQPSAL